MADKLNKISVDPEFDYSQLNYLPIRYRRGLGFSKVIHILSKSSKSEQAGSKDQIENVKALEMKWPDEKECELIAKWCRREDIYSAFGFKRPPAGDYIRRSRLPNCTGSFEPVELLIVRDHDDSKPIGFFIVYEGCKGGGTCPEIDFALTEKRLLGSPVLLRHIKICILSYLFRVRGATMVKWQRLRKKDPVEISPEGLKREIRKKGPDFFPTIWMQHINWIQA